MRLGRVEVTGGFLLLAAWLNYLDRSLLVPAALTACALHELGHILVIRLLGGNIKGVRLTAVGAELVLARPLGYWQEGLSALAGPGTNLVLALAFCGTAGGLTFAGLNLELELFKLLPGTAGRRAGTVLYPGPAGRAGHGRSGGDLSGLPVHRRNSGSGPLFGAGTGQYHTAAGRFLAAGCFSAPKYFWVSPK